MMRAPSLVQGAPIAPIATSTTTTTKATTSPTPRGLLRDSRALSGPPHAPTQRRSVVCATPSSSGAAAAAAAAAASVAAASVSSASAAAAGAAAATAPPPLSSSSSSSLLSSPSASPSAQQQPTEEKVPPFSWTAHWYPVSFVEDLDRSQPNAFTLLGVKLAFYYEEENARWIALEDSCPHRRAPLSQGRLLTEKDAATGKTKLTRLECSYHGWVFGGARGKCSLIPQLEGCPSLVSPGAAAAATASPRACATPRPCRVAQGMLWVWGEGPRAVSSGGAAAAGEEEDPVSRMFREAEETEPIYAPGISVDDPDVPSDAPPLGKNKKPEKLLTLAGRYCRDVEYDATTLIDNLMDASHLAFAHTGVLGDRSSEDAGDVAAARVSLLEGAGSGEEEEAETAALAAVLASTPHKREKSEGKGPFLDRHSAAARALRTELLSGDAAVFDSAFRVPRTDMEGGRMLTRMIFEPPALATWFCDKPDGDPVCAGSRWRSMPIFVTPTTVGRCRILFQIRYPDSPKVNKFIKFMLRATPEWISHFQSSEVTDGDSRLLWPTEDRAASAVAAALAAAAAATAAEPPPSASSTSASTTSTSSSPPSSAEVGLAFFKTNYMPAPADAPIVAYRKWLFGRGGGGPFGSPFAPSPLLSSSSMSSPSMSSSSLYFSPPSNNKLPEHLAEASVLSRYEQHTKHCRSCSVALKNATRVRKAGAVAALLLASAAAGAAGGARTAPAAAAVAARWALAAAAAALAAWAASRVERKLTYTGYNHSHKH